MAGLSFAQDAGSTQPETIRLLVQQVKELQEKVKALEANRPARPRRPGRLLLNRQQWSKRSPPPSCTRRACTSCAVSNGGASGKLTTKCWTSGSPSSDVTLRHGPSFGARYDFNDNLAFKTQLDHTVRKAQPDLNGLQMQLAFTF